MLPTPWQFGVVPFFHSLIPFYDDTIKIKRKKSLKKGIQVVQEKLVWVNFLDHKNLVD